MVAMVATRPPGRRPLALLVLLVLLAAAALWNIDSEYNPTRFRRLPGQEYRFANLAEKWPIDYVPSKYIENAHKLPHPDDFLPHFKAVTELPGLTMLQAKSTCNWPDLSRLNFQYQDTVEWAVKERSDAELAKHRKKWQKFIMSSLVPWTRCKERYQGRGIVVLAGDGRSLMRLKVLLRQLKNLQSRLPVEIHSWGDEINSTRRAELANIWPSVHFNDLSSRSQFFSTRNDNIWKRNFQLKTAAVLNSRFAEPLLLDSDNVPAIDPSQLYGSATYREFGSLFWPDIARTRPNNPAWALTNTPCRKDEYEQESGQLLVDKRRLFYHLQLAHWMIHVQGGYYNDFLLGDKDVFRFAWHALKTRYGAPKKWVTSVGSYVPTDPKDNGSEKWYCGHTFAQHHPDDGRVAFMHGGLLKTMARETMIWLRREYEHGVFQAYKRSPDDQDANSTAAKAVLKWDSADYLPDEYRPRGDDGEGGVRGALCVDFEGVEAKPLTGILAGGFNDVYEKIGGYWILRPGEFGDDYKTPLVYNDEKHIVGADRWDDD